jgi:phosphoglycolate phosphatase-like HAD superfamily hydrolase
MAFKVVVIEYHAFYGPEHRLDPDCHDVEFSEEIRMALYLIKQYGIEIRIVSSMYGRIDKVNVAAIKGLLHGKPRHVRDRVAALREILKQPGLSPHEVLYVDDIAFGIREAKRTGVPTCGLTTGYSGPDILKENPQWTASSLMDVARIANAQQPAY